MSNLTKPKPMVMTRESSAHKGSAFPLLLAVSLIVAFVGILGHYFIQQERILYKGKTIVLFDGVCTVEKFFHALTVQLCNGFVNFVIDRDSERNLQFATLQSAKGQELLRKFELPTSDFKSIIVIEGETIYSHSSGALRVLLKMDMPYSDLYGLIIVPSFIRDYVYGLVSTWRYSIFGKEEFCRAPTPELMDRFLDDKC